MCLGGPGRWEKWVRVRPPCSAMDRWPGGERGQVPGAAGTGAGEDGAQAPSQGSEVITVPWGTREHAHAQCTHTCTCGEQTLAGFRAVRPGPGHPTGRPLPGRGPSGGAGGVPEVSAPWRGSWVPPPPPRPDPVSLRASLHAHSPQHLEATKPHSAAPFMAQPWGFCHFDVSVCTFGATTAGPGVPAPSASAFIAPRCPSRPLSIRGLMPPGRAGAADRRRKGDCRGCRSPALLKQHLRGRVPGARSHRASVYRKTRLRVPVRQNSPDR